MWSRKRITKIIGHCRKVQSKFDLDCLRYRYYASQNKESIITITDAYYFLSINLNDILTIASHLKGRLTNESSIGAYDTTINILNDYIAGYCRTDERIHRVFFSGW